MTDEDITELQSIARLMVELGSDSTRFGECVLSHSQALLVGHFLQDYFAGWEPSKGKPSARPSQ